jgi:hypothetical protein
MDTDDLSIEAYKAVIIRAEKFHHDLTMQFGVLSSSCKNEDEYLNTSLDMIASWEEDIQSAIDDIFFDDTPHINRFKTVLNELKKAIEEVQKIPPDKRTYEKW